MNFSRVIGARLFPRRPHSSKISLSLTLLVQTGQQVPPPVVSSGTLRDEVRMSRPDPQRLIEQRPSKSCLVSHWVRVGEDVL